MDQHPLYFLKAFLGNEKLFFTASPSGNCKYIFVTATEFSTWDCGVDPKLFSDFNEHQVWRLIPIFIDDNGKEVNEDDPNSHRSNYYYIECQHFGNAKVLTAFNKDLIVLAENEQHPNQQWSLTLAGSEGGCEIGNRYFQELPLALIECTQKTKDNKETEDNKETKNCKNVRVCIFDKSKTAGKAITFVWFLQDTIINVSLRYQDNFLHDGIFFLNDNLVSSHLAVDEPETIGDTNINKFSIQLENHVPGADPDSELVYVQSLPDSRPKRNEIWNSQLAQQSALSLLHLFPGQSDKQIEFRDKALSNLEKQIVCEYKEKDMPLLWVLDTPEEKDRNLKPENLSQKPLIRHQLSLDNANLTITLVIKNVCKNENCTDKNCKDHPQDKLCENPEDNQQNAPTPLIKDNIEFKLFYFFIVRDGVRFKIIDPSVVIRRGGTGPAD